MKLELKPTEKATKNNKKAWLMHEIARYRAYIKMTNSLKIFISIMIIYMVSNWLSGWVGVASGIGLMIVFDFLYEFAIFLSLRDYYLDLVDACFDVEDKSGGGHDLRILMNRVDNLLNNKDKKREKDLRQALVDTHQDLSVKLKLEEAIEEINKITK